MDQLIPWARWLPAKDRPLERLGARTSVRPEAGWKPNTFHLAGYRQLIDVFVDLRLGQRMPWGRGLPAGFSAGKLPALPGKKATNLMVLGWKPVLATAAQHENRQASISHVGNLLTGQH